MYDVQNIELGKARDTHVAHVWFYADGPLKMTVDPKKVFQRTFTQVEVLIGFEDTFLGSSADRLAGSSSFVQNVAT